ncbi:hypothetical protein BU26DRAFT_303911 [Trematosphaeria pertusa]|uniref:Uncharacterized protein n=1 Tax=Trematosphaeria pertusa TaxID=390896 RepID=A0A6A6IEQ8_9PLEO|nr:uncharacterized protein BU26DRAFT_303911 [Trematosphaeria pertusa]KAF2248679.1 hypothetical protein BU26DRAFT_303911 [Trematosphaeria pertusa]
MSHDVEFRGAWLRLAQQEKCSGRELWGDGWAGAGYNDWRGSRKTPVARRAQREFEATGTAMKKRMPWCEVWLARSGVQAGGPPASACRGGIGDDRLQAFGALSPKTSPQPSPQRTKFTRPARRKHSRLVYFSGKQACLRLKLESLTKDAQRSSSRAQNGQFVSAASAPSKPNR